MGKDIAGKYIQQTAEEKLRWVQSQPLALRACDPAGAWPEDRALGKQPTPSTLRLLRACQVDRKGNKPEDAISQAWPKGTGVKHGTTKCQTHGPFQDKQNTYEHWPQTEPQSKS